jgi:ABC-2 type transport system permease protein
MSAAIADVVPIRVAERSWRSEVRAVKVVWRRELIRFTNDRTQMLMWLIQPLLFLFVLGTGLQTLSARSTDGVDMNTFMFPGVLCMAAVFTGIFSSASLVWDRELGFLRELLVAPVGRSSIVIGKCLGGATAASLQGAILLALGGLVGVPYSPVMIIGVLALLMLLSFTVTAFGVLVAVSIKRPQTFTFFSQMLVMPLFFISAAFFPVAGLTAWLRVLNRLDPVTYAVDPMRRLVFDHLDTSDAARHTLAPGVSWWGWHVPALLEMAIVLYFGLAMLGLAIWKFSKTE